MTKNNTLFAIRIILCSSLALSYVCVHAADKIPHSKPELVKGKPEAAQVRKEIQAVYDQQSAALSRKDVKGFLALCTPEYQDLVRGNVCIPPGLFVSRCPARYRDTPHLK